MPAARGALLQYESETATFTTIPGVGDFTLPLGEAEIYEEDSHDVTGGSVHKTTGKLMNQPFTVPVDVWDGSNTHHAAMAALLGSTATENFKVTAKDGKVYTFAAYVVGLEISHPKSGGESASLTLHPTGDITEA
jgi:hypothetical protein